MSYTKQFSFKRSVPATGVFSNTQPSQFIQYRQDERTESDRRCTVTPQQQDFNNDRQRYFDSNFTTSTGLVPQPTDSSFSTPARLENQQTTQFSAQGYNTDNPKDTAPIRTALDQTPEAKLADLFGEYFEESSVAVSNIVSSGYLTSTSLEPGSSASLPTVEYTTEHELNSLADTDLTAIAEAIASTINLPHSPTGPYRNPTLIPVPSKGMKSQPTHTGKRISMERGVYRATCENEVDMSTDDRYYENYTTVDDPNDSSEEEVDSPVGVTSEIPTTEEGKSRTKTSESSRKRRYSGSSLSSASSREVTPIRQQPPVQRSFLKQADEVTLKKKKKSSHREEQRDKKKRNKSKRSVSRSPSRQHHVTPAHNPNDDRTSSLRRSVTPARKSTPIPPVDREPSVRRSVTPAFGRTTSRNSGTEEAAFPSKEGPRLKNYDPQTLPSRPTQKPPSNDLNDSVYKSVMEDKYNRKVVPQDVDNVSAFTASTTRRRRVNQKTALSPDGLIRKLPKDVSDNELAKETVKLMLRTTRGTAEGKATTLNSAISYITRVKPDVMLIEGNGDELRVDTEKYLLYAARTGFGYEYDMIYTNVLVRPASLWYALREETCNAEKDSLDLVFRSALKEMADEIYEFDVEREIDSENPGFISGRYLELRLLQKIKRHYFNNGGRDIIPLISGLVPGEQEHTYVTKSACRDYLKRLLGLYNITATNCDQVVGSTLCSPTDLRVWTNPDTQKEMNVMINDVLTTVIEDVRVERMELTEGERGKRLPSFAVISKFSTRMSALFEYYNSFFGKVFNASELFGWMCFGLTTNDHRHGTMLMAQSAIMAKVDTGNGEICWNYPLASMYRKGPSPASVEPLCQHDEEFYNRFQSKVKFDL